jgi:hypothetical protein
VVGEYITGVACLACQPHEYAFDSLLHKYPATQFIALAYHQTVNFPIADPFDSLTRRLGKWYGTQKWPGFVPRGKYWDNWIDGHATESNGNLFENVNVRAAQMVRSMTAAIDTELKKAPEAVLHIDAHGAKGVLMTQVHVDSLAPGHRDVYVRICLVEDTVLLQKAPGQKATPRLNHYMVVRAVSQDSVYPLGLPLPASRTVSYTFPLMQKQQRLLHYWELGNTPVSKTASEEKLSQMRDIQILYALFPDKKNWLMNPARLHVVAFVQDAHTGDVLQAAMIPVGNAARTALQ